LVRPDAPDFDCVGRAVAEFESHHPYLLFRKSSLASIRQRANASKKLLARFEKLVHKGSRASGEEVRAAIKRRARGLINSSFIALVANDSQTKAQALIAARSDLAEFSADTSWHQRPIIKSFLDCSEIAVSVALAYDWLYDQLSVCERRVIEQAIFRNVLQPALDAYNDSTLLWPKRRDNCTAVSNSGILISALA